MQKVNFTLSSLGGFMKNDFNYEFCNIVRCEYCEFFQMHYYKGIDAKMHTTEFGHCALQEKIGLIKTNSNICTRYLRKNSYAAVFYKHNIYENLKNIRNIIDQVEKDILDLNK